MVSARVPGCKLETRAEFVHPCHTALYDHAVYYAWVSDDAGLIWGYAKRTALVDAVRGAIWEAGCHYAKDMDALAALELAYFGPNGMCGQWKGVQP